MLGDFNKFNALKEHITPPSNYYVLKRRTARKFYDFN